MYLLEYLISAGKMNFLIYNGLELRWLIYKSVSIAPLGGKKGVLKVSVDMHCHILPGIDEES